MAVNSRQLNFENYLKTEGVKHELTVPKTPEQNGVADERLNRTLVEAERAMLIPSKTTSTILGGSTVDCSLFA